MTTWVWKSLADRRRTIEADIVQFESGHVAFFQRGPAGPSLLLAVRNQEVLDLHPEPEGAPVWWS